MFIYTCGPYIPRQTAISIIQAKQQGMLLLEGPDKPKLPKPPQHKLKPGQHTESVNAVTVRRGGGILLLGKNKMLLKLVSNDNSYHRRLKY